MRIGFIGLGNMGGPMALNLIKAGHALVVHDVRSELAKAYLERGAKAADNPRGAAQGAELILTSLPGPAEVESVALGERGVIHGAAKDAVYADLSTGSPRVMRTVKAGVRPEALLAAVKGGAFGQGLLLTQVLPEIVFKGDFDTVRFALRLARKDLGLATELAREFNVPMEMAALAEQTLIEALARGWGDKDFSAPFMLQEERAGVKVRT